MAWKLRLSWGGWCINFSQEMRADANLPYTASPSQKINKVSTQPLEAQSVKRMLGVVFSKDRPLQLEATLASFNKHCVDREKVSLSVLYKATSGPMAQLYRDIEKNYPDYQFVREGIFKSDLINILGDAGLVLFLVDDNLFVQDFSLRDIEDSLGAEPDAIGFSLRLGSNTTYCYTQNKYQRIPTFVSTKYRNIVKYSWISAEADFSYPLEVSSSIFRYEDIEFIIQNFPCTNPNLLEEYLSQARNYFSGNLPNLLCYEKSRTFLRASE